MVSNTTIRRSLLGGRPGVNGKTICSSKVADNEGFKAFLAGVSGHF
jgi:hypothetical protein